MSKKKPTRFRPPGEPLSIEDFKVKLIALVKKFPGKRTSELPVKWSEEFGVDLNYQDLGFSSLLPCLECCRDVIELYFDDGRRDVHYRVRLKPNAKTMSETLSLPPPCERKLDQEEIRRGRREIDGEYSADDQLSRIIDASCQSCRDLTSFPIAFRCGHLVCKDCLEPGPKASCPKKACVRRAAAYREISEDSKLYDLLWQLPVKCCNNGCPWKGTRDSSIGHVQTCPLGSRHSQRVFGDALDAVVYKVNEPMSLEEYERMISELFDS